MDVKIKLRPFQAGKHRFECWLVQDGINEIGQPAFCYVWRTVDGRRRVTRNVETRAYSAVVDEHVIGTHYAALITAMQAAAAHRGGR